MSTERRCDFCGEKGDYFAQIEVPHGWTASLDAPPKPKKEARSEDDYMRIMVAFSGRRESDTLDACLSCVRRLLALREQFLESREELVGR